MPFRRKSDELIGAPAAAGATDEPVVTAPDPTDAPTATGPNGPSGPPAATDAPAAGPDASAEPDPASGPQRTRGYTPSKRELGRVTPKRPSSHLRRPGTVPPTRSGRKLTKEEKQELRQARRQQRREASEGMRRGDPRYLLPRDQGPERAIARDVVDSRRTVGTWFFAGALVVLLGSSATMPPQVRLVSTALWSVLAAAVVLDCVLLCRKVGRLVRERHPDSRQRMGGLYWYTVMRSLTFRRMRIPLPRLNYGDRV